MIELISGPDDDGLAATIVIAALALTLAATRMPRWVASSLSTASLFLRFAVSLYVANAAIASWETLPDPHPIPGWRAYTNLCATSWVLAALIYERRADQARRDTRKAPPCPLP